MTPTALIAGDGMAGALACAALKQAGWRVVMARRPDVARPHLGHVHTVAIDTLRQMEVMCRQPLDGWQRAEAVMAMGGDTSPAPARPVVEAERLHRAVLAAAMPDDALTEADLSQLEVSGGQWRQGGGRFDLLIDATGPAPVVKARLAALSGVALEWLESEAVELCATFTGHAYDVAGHAAMTVLLPDLRPQVDGILMLDGHGGAQVSLRGARAGSVAPGDLAEALSLAGGAAFLPMTERLVFATPARLYRTPLGRRANHEDVDPDLPPVLSLGDALVQAAPSLGQGLRLLAQQAETLRELTGPEKAKALRETQIGQAQGLWLMSQMKAGLVPA